MESEYKGMSIHPLLAAIQALSGVPPESSRARHILGLCRQIRDQWPTMAVTPKAMEKWFETGLPNKWRLGLALLADKKGIEIELPEIQKETVNG